MKLNCEEMVQGGRSKSLNIDAPVKQFYVSGEFASIILEIDELSEEQFEALVEEYKKKYEEIDDMFDVNIDGDESDLSYMSIDLHYTGDHTEDIAWKIDVSPLG